MFKRYWLPFIVVGIALALAPVFYAFWHSSRYAEKQQDLRNEIAQYQADHPDDESIKACDPPKTTDTLSRIKCILDEINTKRSQKRDDTDLVAQQDMAFWALGMLWATAIGVGFTFIGVVLVVLNLEEARKAVREAGKANTISRKTARCQLRAYFMIAGAEYVPAREIGQVGSIRITFKNFGQTPARNVRVRTFVAILKLPPEFLLLGDQAYCNPSDYGPEQSMSISRFLPADFSIQNTTRKAFVVGYAKYTNVFDEEQTTRFCLIGTFDSEREYNIVPWETGNSAT